MTVTDEAQAALRATPTADLLRTAYALTHRMGGAWPAQVENLRAQRDLIGAEVERRVGGLIDLARTVVWEVDNADLTDLWGKGRLSGTNAAWQSVTRVADRDEAIAYARTLAAR